MKPATKVIDCNVHHAFKQPKELLPYLQEPWKSQVSQFDLRSPRTYGPPGRAHIDCTYEPEGANAAANPELLSKTFMDAYNMEYAILTGGMYAISVHSDPDYSAALASAYNDHLIERWLPTSSRYKGAMTVATQDPLQAAREIDRVGGHPGIVQISISSGAPVPYGQRRYYPIYEAAERHGLPIAIHPGTEGGGIANPPTAAGYVSDYFQFHTALPQSLIAHMISIIGEGVPERFPSLKFIIAGSGVSWLPHLMWRMDRNYKALRATVPGLKKRPSETIRDHFYLTTQPIDESDNPDHMRLLFEMTDAENMLLYASGFPDWDFDDPSNILPGLPERAREAIFYANAKKLFSL
ncbi:MAG: amidohydrolase [Paenibacillus sp.]|nr:amidohydrolase [Paenibacillus sp.]